MVVNVPALTDADTDKILLANMPTDGAAPSLWYPPFWLDSKYSGADGTTGIVAYRADQPFTYTTKGIPILTKTLKFAAIPSILDGLQITKDGTSGVTVSAGHVRYLDSNLDWQEVATPAQSIAIGAPTGNVETLYVVVYDLQTSPKLDVYKPAKDLFDAAPNAATVDPNEPAIIVGRVDLDGDGDIIAIFNDGIHAGLESQKAEDLRELIGVIQHNIEPKIEATYKTTLSFVDLPDKYIIGYTNFGKAKPDNRFPYIGAFIAAKPNVVQTEFIDSQGGVIIPSGPSIASQELEKYTADSNPAGTPLKRDEFVMHPIFVYLDLDSSPVLKYAIVRSAVVLRKSPLSPLPLEKQIKKYMLEETLGGTEVPQFVTDFCALCGFLVVDNTMNLRTTIEQAKIIPATEGFSSIQDRPSSLTAPSADDSGLLVVKEGAGAVPIGLPKGIEGGVYVKESGHIVSKKGKATQFLKIIIKRVPPYGGTGVMNFEIDGYNHKGRLDAAALTILKNSMTFEHIRMSEPNPENINITPLANEATVASTLEDNPMISTYYFMVLQIDNAADLDKVFGTTGITSMKNVTQKLIHTDFTIATGQPNTATDKASTVTKRTYGSLINGLFKNIAGPDMINSYNLHIFHTATAISLTGYNLESNKNNRLFKFITNSTATNGQLNFDNRLLNMEQTSANPKDGKLTTTQLNTLAANGYSGQFNSFKSANIATTIKRYHDRYDRCPDYFDEVRGSLIAAFIDAEKTKDTTNNPVSWFTNSPNDSQYSNFKTVSSNQIHYDLKYSLLGFYRYNTGIRNWYVKGVSKLPNDLEQDLVITWDMIFHD